MTSTDDARAKLKQLADVVDRARTEIGKRVVGQREVVDQALLGLLAGGHVLLEGVPGLGKTLLVRTIAQTFDLSFSRVQFTPDLMPSDILGTTLIVEDDHGRKEFRFQKGPIFAHLVLADEVNRATPKTQSALLEVMQERAVTISTQTHKLEDPFFVLATQNPLEMEGTYPLPEAQVDRFLLKVQVPFPTREELSAILDRTTGHEADAPTPVVSRQALLGLQQTVRDIAVAPHVRDYVVRIVEATHPHQAAAPKSVKQFARYGASPRGAQSTLLAAKARAAISGRAHASADDVRAVAKAALRHRVLLNFEGEAERIASDVLLDEVLSTVQAGEG